MIIMKHATHTDTLRDADTHTTHSMRMCVRKAERKVNRKETIGFFR
jgi:hypothetical protein